MLMLIILMRWESSWEATHREGTLSDDEKGSVEQGDLPGRLNKSLRLDSQAVNVGNDLGRR